MGTEGNVLIIGMTRRDDGGVSSNENSGGGQTDPAAVISTDTFFVYATWSAKYENGV